MAEWHFLNRQPALFVTQRMRRVIRIFLFLLIIPLAGLAVFPQIIRCQFIENSPDFVAITPTIFVSRDTPMRHREALRLAYGQARERVGQFWSSPPQGRAQVIFCNTPDRYTRYCRGGEGAGCSLGTPWGDSWVIVNPHGRNTDVLAHELCHDELYTRLGWLTTQRQIPQWFNEGLALMVDYRFTTGRDSLRRYADYHDEWQYLTHGQQVEVPLSELESTRDFFGGSPARVRLAYAAAALEVSHWLAGAGRQAVPQLVQAVANGHRFEEAYRQVDRRKTSGKQRRQPLAH